MNQAIGEYTSSTTYLSALSYINPEKNPSNVQVLPLTPVKCVVLTVQLFWQDWISFHSSVVNGSAYKIGDAAKNKSLLSDVYELGKKFSN